jgi:Glu-tRNA(Gln) amidotransferase subunit E-like FAD-binding protein
MRATAGNLHVVVFKLHKLAPEGNTIYLRPFPVAINSFGSSGIPCLRMLLDLFGEPLIAQGDHRANTRVYRFTLMQLVSSSLHSMLSSRSFAASPSRLKGIAVPARVM